MAREIYFNDVQFSKYSYWHRSIKKKLAYIDIDKCGICHTCWQPLYLAELAFDVNQTYKRLKISKKNYYRQYLAYHEGWKNYKSYNKKSNVVSYAKQVSVQAKKYRYQLNRCKRKLNKKKYIIF